jgi:hypothetical protein
VKVLSDKPSTYTPDPAVNSLILWSKAQNSKI